MSKNTTVGYVKNENEEIVGSVLVMKTRSAPPLEDHSNTHFSLVAELKVHLYDSDTIQGPLTVHLDQPNPDFNEADKP